MPLGTPRVQAALALAVTLVGVVLTTVGALAHTGPAIAPGAVLITLGGAWLGNALARARVRLVPNVRPPEDGEA